MTLNKIVSHIKWFFAIIPLGICSALTAPFIYPLAYYTKWKIFWLWLDDEIYSNETNQDWLIFCNGEVDNFKHLYKWHGFRNTMWNLKQLIKPQSARINCYHNEEEIVQVIQDNLKRNGKRVSIYNDCLELASWRFIDKNGNEGWQVNKGVKVSRLYSTVGTSELWYKANGKLYYRYSTAREFKVFGKSFYFTFAIGATEKRYLLILKIQ